ncbi:MAG: DUF3147 family protein [Candidatus Dormibacteraceae bacterium]
MNDILIIGLKMMAGGSFVVAFALISDILRPKTFAGMFSAAPSVAMAGLVITALAAGGEEAATYATGMIGGAVAMVACCIAATLVVKRFGSVAGSAFAWLIWLAVAGVVFWIFLR